ncbi:glycosyltransferase [Aestuariirhabdus sp. LZHN29]|uniref:glycosyltransferase n=1 Tax=Aestuariirhabdus sp. LZHN29 TaxID=3417462 RepID=UPI003CF7BB3A
MSILQKTGLPKISVITPSFNQGGYIRETIESVLSQGYPNLEYIIVDGGSTDDTVSIVNEYVDRIDHFVSQPDNGQSHAINKGFSKATGDIFCWLNSDDQFAPDALLSAALAFITSDSDLIAGICEVYEDGNLTHRHLTSCGNGQLALNELLDLDNGWNAGQFFYQPEVFFTRSLWQRSGGHVREDCYYSMDYELWCRFALAEAKIKVIGTPMVHFRTHADQKTANPEKFKAELLEVRDNFCKENNIDWSGSKRPLVNWGQKLKVAFVNDIGYQYGAGIAHMRIAGAFELAGHNVAVFDLLSSADANNYQDLVDKVKTFSPHFVVFGNLHAVDKSSVSILSKLESHYPCYWLTHDFWLITGRCAYTSGCDQYLAGCNDGCPTHQQYPMLDKEFIAPAWKNKHEFLSQSRQFNFLANSSWSKSIIDKVLSTFSNNVESFKISLGAPVEIFKPRDKIEAKEKLNISPERFVIAFSVSSLSDGRKGGALLVEALQQLSDKAITLILIGKLDQPIDLPGIDLVKLGYVNDVSILVSALQAADVYVGPSAEETFGQVFVEAAMCGTPSIGFNVTGVKDAVMHGVTGVRVDEVSAGALALAIMSFYDDRALLKTMSEFAPIYCRNEFSLEASYFSFFSVLNQQGLIDRWSLPHKISFSKKSAIVNFASKGWHDLTITQKLNHKIRASVNGLVDFLPNHWPHKIAKILPGHVKNLLVRWLTARV